MIETQEQRQVEQLIKSCFKCMSGTKYFLFPLCMTSRFASQPHSTRKKTQGLYILRRESPMESLSPITIVFKA